MSLDNNNQQTVSDEITQILSFCYINGLEPLEAVELVVRETLGWLMSMQDEKYKNSVLEMKKSLEQIQALTVERGGTCQ